MYVQYVPVISANVPCTYYLQPLEVCARTSRTVIRYINAIVPYNINTLLNHSNVIKYVKIYSNYQLLAVVLLSD